MTFSRFEGDSTRNINLRSFGGAFAGAVGGDPDVTMWTLGLHAGARIRLGSQSLMTPYANLDHVHAKLGGFTERTGSGNKAAELTVRGGRVAASFAGAGAKWEARIGGFSTEASVGFRYRLGDRRSALTAAFTGSERDAFQIVSDAEKRGTFIAGFSLGGRLGRAELKMGYAGEINSEATRHRGEFSVIVPIGRTGSH